MVPAARTAIARRVAVGASIAVLLFLVPYDVVRSFVIQRALLFDEERILVSPRDIEKVARANRLPVVAARIGVYYHVAQRIAGSTVTLPPEMRKVAWEWEHVGQIHVRFSDTPLLVAEDRVRRLRRSMPAGIRWLRQAKTPNIPHNRYQAFFLAVDRSTREYVLAQSPGGEELFLIPAARYAEVAAKPGEAS